jgi:cAMP-dependent protein kinase regulator
MTVMHERLENVPGYRAPDDRAAHTPTPDERDRWTQLREVPILRDIDDEQLWPLAALARPASFAAGQAVMQQGDRSSSPEFFVIVDGAADVLVEDERGAPYHVAGLVAGDYFGEAALLTDAPRNATIQAAGPGGLRVLVFDAVTFLGVIAHHVLVFRMVRAQRASGEGGALRVRELGLFSDMPLHALSAVLHDAEQRHYPAGSDVVTQGDAGDRFHVLLDGEVVVERDGAELARLSAGDFFGETALLFDCPRTATVRASGPCMTWSIGRQAFERVLRHYLMDNRRSRDTIARRIVNLAA